jgi:hypothetical protein
MHALKRIGIALLVLVGSATVAWAQAGSGSGGGGWENVDSGQMMQPGEGFQANHLVATAYAFIWLAAIVWVALTWRRAGALERDLDELRRRIDQQARSGK